MSSNRRSFADLTARYADSAAGELFLSLAQGEGTALGHLGGLLGGWAGSAATLEYEPTPGAHGYTAYVTARSQRVGDRCGRRLPGQPRRLGVNCGRAAAALRSEYDADDTAVTFFEFFATPAPGFEEEALAVIEPARGALRAPVRPCPARHSRRWIT